MAFRLPRLPRNVALFDPKTGYATPLFQQWWQSFAEAIEAEIGALEAAQAAEAAATTAQAAAVTAQAAADAAQAAVDAIVVPPSGVITITTNTVLSPSDVTVLVDATGGAVAVTLSAAGGYSVPVVITKIDATGNSVDISPQGGETVNGGAGPVSITTPNEQHSFTADQVSQWFG